VSQRRRRGSDQRVHAAREIAKRRAQIDRVDAQILALLNRRAGLAQEIGRKKAQHSAPAFVPARERKILGKLLTANKGPLPARAVAGIFREIIAASRALEEPLSVAYLGPEATFTEAAAREQFGVSASYLGVDSIPEVFAAVESERADAGVVPVENSTEGVVALTLDTFIESPLKICSELELKVRHCLMARRAGLKGIRRIVSHPQSLAQCRSWLVANCPGILTEPAGTNARAAQLAAKDMRTAAIAGATAAERYGLRILAEGIQDDPSNVTRFLVLAKHDAPLPSGSDKTSILMMVRDDVGVLHKILRPFSSNRINLCHIVSRPLRGKPWEYVFFVDLQRHRREPAVRRALGLVGRHCTTLKVLGSYPTALPGVT